MPITHLDCRKNLVEALRYDLVGPMLDDELLDQRPTRWYLTGFLVPKGAGADDRSDPLGDEDLSSGGSSGDDDDDGAEDPGAATPGWFPSSFGLSVLVPADSAEVTVRARWGEYQRLDPAASLEKWKAHQPDRLAQIQRVRGPAGEVEGAEAPPSEPPKVRAPDPLWQRKAREAETTIRCRTGAYKLPGSAGINLHVLARPAAAPGLPPGTVALSVFLVNERAPEEQVGIRDQRVIFQVAMELESAAGFVARTDWSGADANDPDIARADLQYRDLGEWAVGHGVSAEAEPAAPGAPTTCVRTSWLPSAVVRRMEAVEVPGVTLSMEALAKVASAADLAASVEPMLATYTTWIATKSATGGSLSGGRALTAQGLLARAAGVRDRIRSGLAYLATNGDAFEAFKLTNHVMAEAALRGNPGRYDATHRPSWRLFQLAFVLLNVESVGNDQHPDREAVELLFFPTGGGKTEAYLGVAAFAMLLRRLRGRERADGGAGVAVLLRYTLRLLTLDQLGRAATLICALEVLRRKNEKALGTHRFSIGLWVGRSGTANRMKDAEKQLSIYKANPKDPRRSSGVPLASCPWCRTAFVPNCFGIDKREGDPWALRVRCANLDCDFHADASRGIGIPVAVVDEQVYRELPAFLLATVDKFAVLPWRGSAGALFGRVAKVDGGDFFAVGDRAPARAQNLPGNLLPPELIIQDELHLITGPLGTMVGLYETAIDHLSRGPNGSPPKIIASTATARRAGHQIRALYGRKVVEMFPPPGLDASDTFFSRTDTAVEATRQYVGVAAPGRSLKAIAVRVYSTLLSAAYKDWHRSGGGASNPADTYATLVTYFNTLRDLGGAQRLVQEEVAPRCGRLDMRHAFQEASSPWCRSRNLNFEVLELTSRQSTDDIRKATIKLRAPYQSPDGGKNDVLLASSMISVGVDIPRLGLMVMNGQPRTVAEYIQATSRVGRETPGLVVTVHNLRRPRDRSHYERFSAFHEGFYRMVEAASVTPFSSRAIDRGLAGVVVTLARHGWRPLTPNRAVDRVDTIASLPGDVGAIVSSRAAGHAQGVGSATVTHLQQRVQSLVSDWSAIVNALDVGGVPMIYSPWESAGGEPLLSTAVDPPSPKDPRLVRFRAPTSMRDVEPGVHLWVEPEIGGGDGT